MRTHRQTDRQTDRHTPMTTRPCGLRRAGKYTCALTSVLLQITINGEAGDDDDDDLDDDSDK